MTRARAIALGVLRPGRSLAPATPFHNVLNEPVLRLDAAGRAAAQRHLLEGESGARELTLAEWLGSVRRRRAP